MKEKSFVRSVIHDVLFAVLLALLVLCFIQPTIVRQSSMEETFFDGDYLIVSKQSYAFSEPKRGDVITFKSDLELGKSGNRKILIKRVIGLPGDTVRIQDGDVYINEERLVEEYTGGQYTEAEDFPFEGVDLEVPEGSYYCLGDNRDVSVDSRDSSVGFVSKDDIQGKVVFRLFPFSSFGVIK